MNDSDSLNSPVNVLDSLNSPVNVLDSLNSPVNVQCFRFIELTCECFRFIELTCECCSVMKGGRLSPDLASECAAVHIDNIKTQDLVTESGKLVFLIKLVDRLKTEGHRCLIFSQSLKVLDIITKILDERVGPSYCSLMTIVKSC